MKLPKILDTKILARSNFFRIESLQLEFSNGVRREYERLPAGTREAVIVVAVNPQNEVMLIREYAAGFHENQLTLPKGAADPGESIEAAANRELAEEIGFGAHHLEVVKKLSLAPGHMGFTINVVFAKDLYPFSLPGDEPEPPELVPWPSDQIEQLIVSDDFNEARAIVALMLCEKRIAECVGN